jgi:hypothetical protein
LCRTTASLHRHFWAEAEARGAGGTICVRLCLLASFVSVNDFLNSIRPVQILNREFFGIKVIIGGKVL